MTALQALWSILPLYALALAPGSPDLAALADSLRETELAFAESLQEKDFELFLSFIEEDAVFTAGQPLRGRQAIGEAWSIYFREDAPRLDWAPAKVEVLPAGDLGLTTGPYNTTLPGESGEEIPAQGTFFSVWRRQADGAWKIIFDSGTPPVPKQAPDPPKQSETR
jgi:uncharacterized protein (TIGR02246 family)